MSMITRAAVTVIEYMKNIDLFLVLVPGIIEGVPNVNINVDGLK